MDDFLDFDGRHILVTGATSGIGRQTAVLLSEHGARVTLVGRRMEKLRETLGMMAGNGHEAVPFDLSQTDAIETLVRDMVERSGPLDGYVQSAGFNKDMPLNAVRPEKLHELMLTNFYSFYELVRTISRKGRYHPGLSIVGVSSIVAECGSASQSAYSATKAAMNGAMRSMARELAAKGIRINCVLPGPTNTEMYQEYLALRAGVKQPAEAKISGTRNYLGMNEPRDVANAIAFLLSGASRMITGVELPVDGGFLSC